MTTNNQPTERKINQLWDLLNIRRLERQNKLNRRLVRKHQDGTVGQPSEGDDMNEDDDTIQIGDNHTYQNQSGGALAKILPWALAAAMGGGLAAPLIAHLLSPKNTPTVEEGENTNTEYGIGFGEPDPNYWKGNK